MSYQHTFYNFGKVCKIDKRSDLFAFGYQYRVIIKKKFFNEFENSCISILGDGAYKYRFAWKIGDELQPAYIKCQWCRYVDKLTIFFKDYNHVEQVIMHRALTVR